LDSEGKWSKECSRGQHPHTQNSAIFRSRNIPFSSNVVGCCARRFRKTTRYFIAAENKRFSAQERILPLNSSVLGSRKYGINDIYTCYSDCGLWYDIGRTRYGCRDPSARERSRAAWTCFEEGNRHTRMGWVSHPACLHFGTGEGLGIGGTMVVCDGWL
jgi:hypothetical protein